MTSPIDDVSDTDKASTLAALGVTLVSGVEITRHSRSSRYPSPTFDAFVRAVVADPAGEVIPVYPKDRVETDAAFRATCAGILIPWWEVLGYTSENAAYAAEEKPQIRPKVRANYKARTRERWRQAGLNPATLAVLAARDPDGLDAIFLLRKTVD